jgi:hypothetical protein
LSRSSKKKEPGVGGLFGEEPLALVPVKTKPKPTPPRPHATYAPDVDRDGDDLLVTSPGAPIPLRFSPTTAADATGLLFWYQGQLYQERS